MGLEYILLDECQAPYQTATNLLVPGHRLRADKFEELLKGFLHTSPGRVEFDSKDGICLYLAVAIFLGVLGPRFQRSTTDPAP